MFETMMHEYFFQMLLLIVCAAAAALGYECRRIYKKHIDSQEKEAVANSAAAFVEQTFKNLHGYEKLMKALEAARKLLAARGIPFSAEEMKILIEAAVGRFNDAFKRAEEGISIGLDGETDEETSQEMNVAELQEDNIYL